VSSLARGGGQGGSVSIFKEDDQAQQSFMEVWQRENESPFGSALFDYPQISMQTSCTRLQAVAELEAHKLQTFGVLSSRERCHANVARRSLFRSQKYTL
jgi:hypothetical protein